MTKSARLPFSLAAMLVALLPSAPAQAVDMFVSSGGSGTACTRTAPCGDFGTAIATGEISTGDIYIVCLDSGSFGETSVSGGKPVIIDCRGTVALSGGLLFDSVPMVTIRHVTFDGLQPVVRNIGLELESVPKAIIEDCIVRRFNFSPAVGIKFAPSTPGSQLVVSDTVLSNNGTGSTGGGIVVNPTGSGSAVVSLDRLTVADNVFGIVADGSGSTAGVAMVIKNSTVHRNTEDGIVATTVAGGAPMGVMVKTTSSVSNNNGIRATGPGVTVRADNATVMHNGTGLVVNNGAALLSAGNNTVEANGVNGAFSGSYTLK